MRAFFDPVACVGTLLLSGCAGGVAQPAGPTPAARQSTPMPQQPTAKTKSASPVPTADAVYARASAILVTADNHLRSLLAAGQSLGDDRPAVAQGALSVVDWSKNDSGIFEQAQKALPVAGASYGLDSWGTDFVDADSAVLAQPDRSGQVRDRRSAPGQLWLVL